MIEKQNDKFSLRKYAAVGLCGVALGGVYMANTSGTAHAAEVTDANKTTQASQTAQKVENAIPDKDKNVIENKHFDQTVEYKNKENDQKLSQDNKQTVDIKGYNVKSQVSVNYHDATEDKDLATDTVNGYVGSKVNYDINKNLDLYKQHGYDVQSNNYKDGNYTKDAQKYNVNLTHRQEVKNKKVKTTTRTINYVDQNGQKIAPSTTQAVQFTYSGDLVDMVTGKVVKAGTWSGDQVFEAVKAPEINNYKFTGNADDLAAKTINHDSSDLVVNAVYQLVNNNGANANASANAGGASSSASSSASSNASSSASSSSSSSSDSTVKSGTVVTDPYTPTNKTISMPNSKIIDDLDSKTATVFYDVSVDGKLVKSGVSKDQAKATTHDVASPDIVGYHLVDSKQNTVKGATFGVDDKDTNKITTIYYAKDNKETGTSVTVNKTILNLVKYVTEDGTVVEKDTVEGADGDNIKVKAPDGYHFKDNKTPELKIDSKNPIHTVVVVKDAKSEATPDNNKSDNGSGDNTATNSATVNVPAKSNNNGSANVSAPATTPANTNGNNGVTVSDLGTTTQSTVSNPEPTQVAHVVREVKVGNHDDQDRLPQAGSANPLAAIAMGVASLFSGLGLLVKKH